VLLVRRLVNCVGATQPCRLLLASPRPGLGQHNYAGYGHWLCCELEEEPYFSLRNYRAPLLLIAGTVFLLSDIGILNVPPRIVWALVAAGICVAFLLEWKYASADPSPSNNRGRGP
jgi:hypothetical protein